MCLFETLRWAALRKVIYKILSALLLCLGLPGVLLHVETSCETNNLRPLHISIFSILQTLSMCIFYLSYVLWWKPSQCVHLLITALLFHACVCVCVCCCVHAQATKVSADGEQVEDDADRIHKRAQDLEQFIRDTLLGAKGSRIKINEILLPPLPAKSH